MKSGQSLGRQKGSLQSSLHPWDEKASFCSSGKNQHISRLGSCFHWRQMESAKHGEGVWLPLPGRGPALRHGSCSSSLSGQFNFMAHLLCTSIMFKASMEVVGSQGTRCVTGDPQDDWVPSEAFLCQGMLVHPTLWWLYLSGNWQENQGDFREKSRCSRMMTGKEARGRKWSCSRGQWSLAEMNWRLRKQKAFCVLAGA